MIYLTTIYMVKKMNINSDGAKEFGALLLDAFILAIFAQWLL